MISLHMQTCKIIVLSPKVFFISKNYTTMEEQRLCEYTKNIKKKIAGHMTNISNFKYHKNTQKYNKSCNACLDKKRNQNSEKNKTTEEKQEEKQEIRFGENAYISGQKIYETRNREIQQRGNEFNLTIDEILKIAALSNYKCYTCNVKFNPNPIKNSKTNMSIGKIDKNGIFDKGNTATLCSGCCTSQKHKEIVKYDGPFEEIKLIEDEKMEKVAHINITKYRYKDFPIELEYEQILQLLNEYNNKCFVCETGIKFNNLDQNLDSYLSIRLDNIKIGYVLSNMFICCDSCSKVHPIVPKFAMKLNYQYRDKPFALEEIYKKIYNE